MRENHLTIPEWINDLWRTLHGGCPVDVYYDGALNSRNLRIVAETLGGDHDDVTLGYVNNPKEAEAGIERMFQRHFDGLRQAAAEIVWEAERGVVADGCAIEHAQEALDRARSDLVKSKKEQDKAGAALADLDKKLAAAEASRLGKGVPSSAHPTSAHGKFPKAPVNRMPLRGGRKAGPKTGGAR
jgi:hypothetical protein